MNYPRFNFFYPHRRLSQDKILLPREVYEAYKKMPTATKDEEDAAKGFLKRHTSGEEWFIEGSPYDRARTSGRFICNGADVPCIVTLLQ